MTTTPTPGRTSEWDRRPTRNYKVCGCVVACLTAEHEPRITFCPLHASAPEMRDALQATADELYRLAMKAPDLNPTVDPILFRARAMLARIAGRE